MTSGGDGISAQTTLTITNGDFIVTSGGGSGKTIAATLSAKSLKGTSLVSAGGRTFNLNTAEDGIHSDKEVIVKTGSSTISAADDGIHSDQTILPDSADISITKSEEGVEAKIYYLNSGNISVVSNDDSFNSTNGARTEQNDGSYTYINSGTLRTSFVPSSLVTLVSINEFFIFRLK